MATLNEFTSYKSAFSLVRSVLLVVLILSFGFNVFMFYKYTETMQIMKSVIYVMDKEGNTSVAEARKAEDVRKKQCEYAAKVAYKLWYEIDEHSYEKNTNQALNYYLGRCGKSMIDDYEQKKTLFNLRDKNLVLSVEIQESKVFLGDRKGYIKGVQIIKRFDGELRRRMDVTFTFFDVSATDENPFGVKFENWNETDNSVIQE